MRLCAEAHPKDSPTRKPPSTKKEIYSTEKKMRNLFRSLSHDLCWLAVDACWQGKWRRNDVLTDIEEWTGYAREELWRAELAHGGTPYGLKYEIMEERADALLEMIEDICLGREVEIDPPVAEPRRDGATGKIREIAYLCMQHQLLGHAVKLGLEPLFQARILPWQHASLPERGQTGLVRQARRYLNRRLGIRCGIKTDCTSAYASTMYEDLCEVLRQEIPRGKWIHACMRKLAQLAPGGHLIIGGYLDAWLFNWLMSYALRHVMALYRSRRGNRIPLVIRCETYMDDFCLMGRSESGLQAAVKELQKWLWEEHRIRLRATTGVIRLWSVAEERQHKERKSPAGRGCPAIDMAGYCISRSHIRLRKRNARRCLRILRRAWAEYQRTGTMKRQRAGSVIALCGLAEGSDCYQLMHKYHGYELKRIAKRIQGYWSREAARKRKEQLAYVLQKYGEHGEARCCAGGCAA